MLFSQGSSENELWSSMKTALHHNQVEKQHGFNKLAQAIQLLNDAAQIFEQANMISEEQEIINILRNLI